MTAFKPIKEGKVREIYDNGNSLIMVATDRISAFDVILKNKVTKKGTVLTQMSKFWFDYTRDLLPNHMLSVDVQDMPEFFRQPQFTGNSMMCRKLTMLPIECIVRGYITGSGWASYQKTGKVCGIQLPEGLQESDKLPEPIYTPSTKAEIGDHEVDGAENRVILSPAPHHIAQHPHDDVVVEHDGTQRDEPPAHQLVAFAHELGHAGIVPVKVHQIIVLRGFFCRQLRAEVQGIEKAVHIHNDAADYQCVQPRGAA